MPTPNRKPNRLHNYDYAQCGAYFVTICTKNRNQILSHICRDDPCGHPKTQLTSLGHICEKTFNLIEVTYNIKFDKIVVMPNHIHTIIILSNNEARTTARVVPTLGLIVGAYKSVVANKWLKICKNNNVAMGQIWQRSFHDHIIRDDNEYQKIWEYIDTNPLKWELDKYYTK